MARLDEELKSRFDSEQHKGMLNVLFTANWMRNRQAGLFSQHGLSAQQYNILRILRGAKGRMNMQRVKERMIDRAPNATRLTDKLIAKGLVVRERCEEDRRVVYVRISEAGLDLLSRMDRKHRDQTKALLQGLTDADARELNRILDQLRTDATQMEQ
jgi:MarR family 2-MHQ and catechol resistance regulon transcriptional repressor